MRSLKSGGDRVIRKKHETYLPQVGRYAELDLVHTQYGIKRVASSFLSLILSAPFSCFSARGHRPRVNGKSSVTYNCASYAIRCLSTSHTVASWHCRFTSRTHWLHTRPVCPCYCCCCCSDTSYLLSNDWRPLDLPSRHAFTDVSQLHHSSWIFQRVLAATSVAIILY